MKALRTLSLTMYKIAHAHKTPMLEGHLRQERHRTTKGDVPQIQLHNQIIPSLRNSTANSQKLNTERKNRQGNKHKSHIFTLREHSKLSTNTKE